MEVILAAPASSQYNHAAIATSFASLELGHEKTSIGAFIQMITSSYQLANRQNNAAAVLGVGTGWELSLLKHLHFIRVAGYEPARAMFDRAQALITAKHLSDIELYGDAELLKLKEKWQNQTHFVLATHVIPALDRRDILRAHFADFHDLLSPDGIGLAITNNPQDQFAPHYAYPATT